MDRNSLVREQSKGSIQLGCTRITISKPSRPLDLVEEHEAQLHAFRVMLIEDFLAQRADASRGPQLARRRADQFGDFMAVLELGAVNLDHRRSTQEGPHPDRPHRLARAYVECVERCARLTSAHYTTQTIRCGPPASRMAMFPNRIDQR